MSEPQTRTTVNLGAGNLPQAAYAQEGVITPAAGLQEFQYVIILNPPINQTFNKYLLNNRYPLMLESCILVGVQSAEVKFRLSQSASEWQLNLTNINTGFFNDLNIVVPTNSVLEVNVNTQSVTEIRFLCRRVALLPEITPAMIGIA